MTIAAGAPAPVRDTGLPPGVRVGALGSRVLAGVVDFVVPVAAALVIGLGNVPGLVVALAVVVGLAWSVLCWRQLATAAASPGMRLGKLQVVGFFDGRPLGWGRVFVRWLVFTALAVTGVGLVLVVISIVTNPRREGWHDRAAGAVVIVERPLAPPRPRPAAAQPAGASPPAGAKPAAAPEPVLAPSLAQIPAPVAGEMALPPEPVLEPVAASSVAEPETAAVETPAVEAPAAAAPEAAETPAPSDVTDPSGTTVSADEPVAAPPPRRTILEGWVAELDDGREIHVRGLVLVGRNPQPSAGEEDAQLVKLADESRTVSKTHLALGVDDAGLFVVDRGSTNGSAITAPGHDPVAVGPYQATSVAEGDIVSMGDHWLRVRREAESPTA